MRQFRPPRGRMCERRAPYRAANSALSSALHGTALIDPLLAPVTGLYTSQSRL
jgi:hypothetical protein